MTAKLPPPINPGYRGPVMVDPANDRPAINPQYRTPWPDPMVDGPRWHRRPAADIGRIAWLAVTLALLAAPILWLFRP